MARSESKYRVEIKRSAAKEIESVDRKSDRRRIIDRIGSLAQDPFARGTKKLAGRRERYRIRQGPYRIVYEVLRDILVVYVVKVGDRKSVY